MKRMRQFLTGWIMLVCAISLVLPVFLSYSKDPVTHDELTETVPVTLVSVAPDALDASIQWATAALEQAPSAEATLAICDESQTWALWPEECVTSSGSVALAAKAIGEHDEQLALAEACVWHVEQADATSGSWRLYVRSDDETWYLQMNAPDEAVGETGWSLRLTSNAAESSSVVLTVTSNGSCAVALADGTGGCVQLDSAENAFVAVQQSEPAALAVLEASEVVVPSEDVTETRSSETVMLANNRLLAASNKISEPSAQLDATTFEPLSVVDSLDSSKSWRAVALNNSPIYCDGADVIAITDPTGRYALWTEDGSTLVAKAIDDEDFTKLDACVWHVDHVQQNTSFYVYVIDKNDQSNKLYLQIQDFGSTSAAFGTVGTMQLVNEAFKQPLILIAWDKQSHVLAASNAYYRGTFLKFDTASNQFTALFGENSKSDPDLLAFWYPEGTSTGTGDEGGDDTEGDEGTVIPSTLPANATITLFDYWLDNPSDDSSGDDDGVKNSGINNGHALKFRKNTNGWAKANAYTDGKITRTGIVASTLVNRYPQLSGEPLLFQDPNDSTQLTQAQCTESLAYLFDPAYPHDGKASYSVADGLFLLGDDGYYTYDSHRNYAYFRATSNDGSTGVLDVYDEPQVLVGNTMGQFYPFTQYSTATKITSNTDPRLDHYLGMHMTLNFTQVNGGKDGYNTDSVFEFEGDDDVWIYIDDVLVSDLGGVHSEVKTNINMATGIVMATDDAGHVTAHRLYDYFETLKSEEWLEANFKEIALNEPVTLADGAVIRTSYIFVDGTSHVLDFFWLERGNWDSDLKIRFNLMQVTEPAIKKVDEKGNPVAHAGFTLTGCNDSGSTGSGHGSLSGYTDASGTWSLWNTATHTAYTMEELVRALGSEYFILQETSVPTGFGSSLADAGGVLMHIVGPVHEGDGWSIEVVRSMTQVTDDSGTTTWAATRYVTTIDSSVSTTVVVMNHPNTFSFTKVDDAERGLGGARFTLTRPNDDGTTGTVLTATSSSADDSLGLVDFGTLSLGTYKLEETSAPEGYDTIVDKYWIVTVANDGVSILEYVQNDSGQYVASESGALSGTAQWWAHLSKSTKAGVASGTGADETTIADDEVPLADSAKTVSAAIFKIANTPTPQPGTIKLIKVDATENNGLSEANHDRLEGVTFLLEKQEGEQWADVETTHTNNIGVITYKNLETGVTYRITEKKTIEGYLLPSGGDLTFTFTVNQDGTITQYTSTQSTLIWFGGDYDSGYMLVIGNEPNGFTLPNAGGVDRARVVNVFLAIIFALMGVTRLCKAMNAESKA